jgi:alpha-methylacyl-CoA racemase
VTPVLSMSEAPGHRHNVARGVFAGEKPVPGAAPRFSATPTAHAPATGRGLTELLEGWGMRSDEARAIAEGTINP